MPHRYSSTNSISIMMTSSCTLPDHVRLSSVITIVDILSLLQFACIVLACSIVIHHVVGCQCRCSRCDHGVVILLRLHYLCPVE